TETKRVPRGSKVVTHHLPAWVGEKGGKLVLIPERGAVVKRIFRLAAAGYGHGSLIAKLEEENVPAFGDSGRWSRGYVAKILRRRRAIGGHRPGKAQGTSRIPDGEPVPGYYPAAVTEEEWLAARAGAEQRKHQRGRLGKHINVFAGLLKHARDGDGYFLG